MQNLITMGRIYSIKLENFEGPLDLLCHLIDKNKMDIYDINISEIADQYIDYINQMEKMNLDITSEFLVMSSTLLYLKSKHLLPKVENEEEEITEEELIRRIIEYKKYKEITKKLKEAFLINSNRLFKMPEEIELPKQKIQKEYTPNIIPEVYQKLLQTNAEKINENAVEDALKGVGDGINDMTNMNNNNNNANTNTTNNTNNNDIMTGIGNDANTAVRNTTGYNATRTATDANTANFLGMNSTMWTWLIIAVAAAVIIALIWYYASSNNRRTNYYDDDNNH